LTQERRFPELSSRHRSGIGTTLNLLDETLCEFEQWGQGRELQSVLYCEKNTLSQDKRRELLKEVAAIRSVIRELRDELGLEGNTKCAASAIWSQCSSLWVSLAEIESSRLKRYGETPPEFSGYYDPKVGQMVDHVKNILKLIKQERAYTD
jgi:hypothetical protein